MLINLFFENINGKLELFLLGAFIFAIYWFILRKYNALGLRLFVLCFLLFIGCCVWIYKDEATLKATLISGEEHIAIVTAKSKTNQGKDNQVSISFSSKDGKTINTNTSEYVSKEEWDKFEYGKPVSVIYVPSLNKTFVQQSIMRFKADKIYLYYFAGFWLVIGVVVLIWLRNVKVGVDESGNEWLVKKDGTIMFDERKSAAAQTMKKVNIVSKMFQAFAR